MNDSIQNMEEEKVVESNLLIRNKQIHIYKTTKISACLVGSHNEKNKTTTQAIFVYSASWWCCYFVGFYYIFNNKILYIPYIKHCSSWFRFHTFQILFMVPVCCSLSFWTDGYCCASTQDSRNIYIHT